MIFLLIIALLILAMFGILYVFNEKKHDVI